MFADEADGIAVRMQDIAQSWLASDGRLVARETNLKGRIETITDRRTALDARMEQVRSRYQKQFNSLDQLVGQLNKTSSFLTRELVQTLKSDQDRPCTRHKVPPSANTAPSTPMAPPAPISCSSCCI